MPKYTDEFVIDRGEWLPWEVQRRLDREESALLHIQEENGRMCCLGVYLRHCGVSKRRERERRIRKLFAAQGIKVKFVGGLWPNGEPKEED